MFRGTYIDFAPEWDTIRRPFLPWGTRVKELSPKEYMRLRSHRSWEMDISRCKRSLNSETMSKVLLEPKKIPHRKNLVSLSQLLEKNPLGPIGSLTKSLLHCKDSKTLIKCNGSILSTNTVSKGDSNGIFKRNVLSKDEKILRTPEDISAIDHYSEQSFLASPNICVVYNMEKREKVCTVSHVSKIHDFVSLNDGIKSAVSVKGGQVALYDASKEIASFQVMPEGTLTNWSCCRLYGDTIMCNDRRTLHFLIPSQTRVLHVNKKALPRDFICDIIISPDERDFSLVTQKELLMYDIRNLKSCIWSRNHGMEYLPASGGDVIELNGTNYYTAYSRIGEVLVWATESQLLKGLPKRFSAIDDVLNRTIFDINDQYDRFACPWTGIRLLSPGRKNKILYVVSMTALGDLFCMEVKRSQDDEETYDWLLESPQGYKPEEMELIKHHGSEYLKSSYIKKSTSTKVFVRPDQSIRPDSKWSFPKVPYDSSQKEPRLNPKNNVFKNVPQFKLIRFDECLDEEGKRVTKILNREQVYTDLPSDVESCASFVSESVRSLSTRSGNSDSIDQIKNLDQKIPSDTNYMLGQFFNDLDTIFTPSNNGTSTIQPDSVLVNEEEHLPLIVASQTEPSESQLMSSQQLTNSQRTKRKRSKVMGF